MRYTEIRSSRKTTVVIVSSFSPVNTLLLTLKVLLYDFTALQAYLRKIDYSMQCS